MENRIDVVLTPENKTAVLQALTTAKTAMPFLVKLSDADRKSVQSIDFGRKPFVDKALEIALLNPELDPGSGLLTAANKDLSLFSFLASAENELLQLLEMVQDTKQLAGSEAYEVARFIYLKAKMNVKMGIPGSQAVVDELGKLFKQTASSKTPAGPA
jgi:hypothetical protein